MADQITTSGSDLGTASETPSIRTFQIDPSGLGGISESLNLFRGDINLPLNLISISSRSGLEASASILYNSSVWKQVDIWNKEAPTGPLGLGWSLGFDFIALDNQDSIAANNNQYYLVSDGSVNRLNLVKENTDYWEFELNNFEFWDVRFYFNDEKWVITKEEGNQYIFGGSTGDATKDPLQYGIKWGQKNGNWKDSSSRVTGQTNFAVAWNLNRIQNPFGDGIDFSYENDLNQIGGDTGLTYTVASRLKMVNSPYSRSLNFHYEDKEYTDTIREYQFPNVFVSNPDFHAYQDRLETKYLDKIELRNASDAVSAPDALLTTVKFKYDIINIAEGNTTDPNFFKRYLTDVIMVTANGLELPNFSFSYNNDPAEIDGTNEQPGALKNIIYPQGGKVMYDYDKANLTGTSRTNEWVPKGIPRIWHGPDYTVYAEYDGSSKLEVKVLSWNGTWIEAPQTFTLSRKINLETLKVSAENDFFSLSFISDENNPDLYAVLFHKENGRFGQWLIEDSFQSLSISSGDQGIVVTGDQFMMALTSPGRFYVKVWDNRTKAWTDKTNNISVPSNAKYALAANSNYLALASYKSNNNKADLVQYYLDEEGDFKQATLAVSSISPVEWLDDSTPDTFWALGNDFFATTYITGNANDMIDYKIQIQQWNEEFQANLQIDESKQIADDTDFPFAQSVVSGSVVGNLESLYRYDGLKWDTGTLPIPTSDTDIPLLIYGSDTAMVTSESSNQINQYNPYSLSWGQTLNGSSSDINPTISYDYFSLGRNVYYRDSFGQLEIVYNLPSDVLGKSLNNRAPFFFIWEDTAGNTLVLPVKNGKVAENPFKLANQKIYNDETDSGTDLVGISSFVTYQGSFSNPSKFTIYQFVNEEIEGEIDSYVVSKLAIDDGYPVTWGDNSIERSNTHYSYDCENVTISTDGTVTEFAAATAIYGLNTNNAGVCYPPPDDNILGRSEYRYHNNGSAVDSGLQLDWEDEDDSTYYYSYLNGMLFDKTDYDQDGNTVQRMVNYYKVHTEYATVNDPSTLLPLIGGYVKTISTESTQYEEPIILGSIENSKSKEHHFSKVKELLNTRSLYTKKAQFLKSRQPQRHLCYPLQGKQTHYPVSMKNDTLSIAVGVTRTVNYEYASDTGLMTADETDNYNMEGELEIFRREIYFAYQVDEYSLLKERHIWSPVAVSIKFHDNSDRTDKQPVEFTLTTYKSWADDTGDLTPWAPARTWIGTSEAAYDASKTIPVTFTDWDNTKEEVDDWRKIGETTLRASSGAVIEALDASKKPSANITGSNELYRVATFANSFYKESAYLGFEAYEDMSEWSVASGSIKDFLIQNDAHTGYTSFGLQADASQYLEKEVSLQNNTKIYILSCWVKTTESFNTDNGKAAWSIEDEQGTELQSFSIEGTNGEWAYRNFVFQIGTNTEDDSFTEVKLIAKNQKETASSLLMLDNILFNPLESDTSVTVYDATYGDVTGSITPSGQTLTSGYDAYRRQLSNSINGKTTSAISLFLIRQWLLGNTFEFPEAYPNAITEILPSTGGAIANLIQGDDWKNEWSSTEIDNWETSDNTLTYTGSSANTISYQPTNDTEDYGAKVSLIQPLDEEGVPIAPTEAVGMALGEDLSVVWNPSTGWSLTLSGTTETIESPIANTSGFGVEWLLMSSNDPVSGNTSVFFMVDGLLLYSNLNASSIKGALSLQLAEKNYGFTGITTFEGANQGTTYLDGSGKELQKVSFDGSGIIVQESVYDQIGRPAIGTKATRIAATAQLYQTDFVKSFNPETGVMTGDVATLNPDAEGFPYVRSEFKRTAQSLVIQQGLPGKDFAISTNGTTENTKINTLEYGTNSADQYPGTNWPANQYFVTKVENANGQLEISVTTKADQEIAKMQGPLDDGSFTTFWTFYDNAQRIVKTIPPNGVAEIVNGTGNGEKWATISNYNFVGDMESEEGPNMNITQYVYNILGEVRFTLTAENTSDDGTNDKIVYNKYDVLGRVIENGYFVGAWDRDILTEKALTNPNYPDASTSHVVLNSFEYDGDGSNPLAYGQLIETKSYSEDSELLVQSNFEYDLDSNLVKKTMLANQYSADSWELSYEYNNLNNLTKITYPSGAHQAEISYKFDQLGQIYAIGNGVDDEVFGVFSYNAEGAITGSTLSLNDSLSIIRASTYNPPGWPVDSENKLSSDQSLIFKESLNYTEGGFEGASYYDGKVAKATYTNEDDSSYSYEYKYDQLSRILTAQNTVDKNLSLGVASPLTYDENGNIISLSRGDTKSEYAYEDATDKVTSIDTDGSQTAEFTYDKDGNTIAADTDADLSNIKYQVSGKLVTSIDIGPNSKTGTPNSTLAIDYDADNNRTVKKLTDSSDEELSAKLYVRGENTNSLFEQEREGSTLKNSQYIYGPDGLTGMTSGDKRYVVVKDHLGNIRKVVDETGTIVASFEYTPFGMTITKEGSTSPDITFYRYTGQEFDKETGLYNFPARMYDPETGRFYTIDPKKVGGTPYAYVLNNPSNLVDPDGEEPLTAFLIAVVIGAVVGAVAGAVTYAVTHQGSFNIGEFFAYTVVGAVAGAIGGAAGYGAGVLATAGLAAAGVSTSSTIASGVVVGAATGAVDGVVSASLNQIGVNLIEGDPVLQGVGTQALIGGGMGLAIGGIAGGITGKLHTPTAQKLADPDVSISASSNSRRYAQFNNAAELHGGVGGDVGATMRATNVGGNEVLTLGGHGGNNTSGIYFGDGGNFVDANVIATDLKAASGKFNGKGIDLTAVCYPGQNGTARTLANELKVPVRAASTPTYTYASGRTVASYGQRVDEFFGRIVKAPVRTYYPNKLTTGWVALFGY
ncbi:RHS repeat domain-containing protein [Kordia sp.]|uniref:RHS repeat domain-containing protein n=1 Tax=Kordia sp. TaxID=1965332 RepID=UPI003D6B7464